MRLTTYLKPPARVRRESGLARAQKRKRPEKRVLRVQKRGLALVGLAGLAAPLVWRRLRH